MGEELPDGTIQGYSRLCEKCGEEISCNIQGNTSQKCSCLKEKTCLNCGFEPEFEDGGIHGISAI
jgi:hypothetical protein